jgi:tRNA pseudouridine synthase 10
LRGDVGDIRDPQLAEPAREAAELGLCEHCLGRCFARVDFGYGNDERGRILVEEHDLETTTPEECHVCEGLMGRVDRMRDVVEADLAGWAFDTFLVGTRVPPDVLEREEMVWEAIGAENTESAKSELNREIGKRVEARHSGIGRENWTVEFDGPDVNAVLDTRFDHVDHVHKSLFVYGRYRKHVRGIPQTRWPCRNCRGTGCTECGASGLNYILSVEDLVAAPAKRATEASEATFHGAGREDVDARCLGSGRPFVLELPDPRRRFVNLDVLRRAITTCAAPAVSVSELAFVDKDAVSEVKGHRGRKTYAAEVAFEDPVPTETLFKVSDMLEGIQVAQRTPSRVAHRRADKTRHRDVTRCLLVHRRDDGLQARFLLQGDAGLYIKELVSGDEGRSDPSLAGLLDVGARCTALDVVDVGGPSALDATIRAEE